MELSLLLIALGIGFSSGLHCLGMCGPIALSLGLTKSSGISFYTENAAYQTGRAFTYALLGAVAGIIGEGFSLAGIQSVLTIFAGIVLILMALLSVKGTDWASRIGFLQKPLMRVRSALAAKLQQSGAVSRFTTGVLNGFLPCGMVFVALTASLAAGGVWQGALFMFFFGLGTFPFMFSAVLFGNLLTPQLRGKLLKGVPVLLLLLGVLFILRGMELGIPYVSPAKEALEMGSMPGQGADCH